MAVQLREGREHLESGTEQQDHEEEVEEVGDDHPHREETRHRDLLLSSTGAGRRAGSRSVGYVRNGVSGSATNYGRMSAVNTARNAGTEVGTRALEDSDEGSPGARLVELRATLLGGRGPGASTEEVTEHTRDRSWLGAGRSE